MSQGKVFGVLLTDQAWVELGPALEPYTSEGSIGRYIYCEEVQLGGQYFVMACIMHKPRWFLLQSRDWHSTPSRKNVHLC